MAAEKIIADASLTMRENELVSEVVCTERGTNALSVLSPVEQGVIHSFIANLQQTPRSEWPAGTVLRISDGEERYVAKVGDEFRVFFKILGPGRVQIRDVMREFVYQEFTAAIRKDRQE